MDPACGNHGSAPSGKSIRCQLVPVAPYVDEAGRPPPTLTLDFGAEGAIGVVDPATDAVITSATLARITATPAKYTHIVSDNFEGASKKLYTQPLLLLQVPGMHNLRIGTPPMRDAVWSGNQFRYAWRGRVRRSSTEGPTHLVTEADWLNLLGRLGLGALVLDEYSSGKLDHRERFARVYGLALLALYLVVFAALLVWLVVYVAR